MNPRHALRGLIGRVPAPSIRFVLTIWYISILAVILSFFSWLLYTNVAANLAQDVSELLGSQAQETADALSAFWDAEQAAAVPDPSQAPEKIALSKLENEQLHSLADRWAQEDRRPEAARPIRLVDRKGGLLHASKSFTQLAPPLTKAALANAQRGQVFAETFNVAKQRIRLITYPVMEDDRAVYVVQVAAVLQQAVVSLDRLRQLLVYLIPLTLVITSIVGWFLATKALRPVGRMTTQVRSIGEGRLEERIDVPHTRDELEQLATTFNDMLERMERAFRRLRQFSAAASHELRTPLTIMRGEIDVALRRPRSPGEYQRVLGAHLQALNEMSQTVEELLVLARSEAVEGVVDWRPVELHGIAGHMCETLRPLAKVRRVHVDLQASEPMWVRGERRLLERLVANLLDNAIHHTPAQGRVTVRLGREGDHVWFAIQDTGSGIPDEALPRIFDRFFRRRQDGDGAETHGLGLGLCRWIAELHRGRIDVASAADRGATLTVWLPASPPSSPA